MIASHELFDLIYDLPSEWKDIVWMNWSDLPCKNRPKYARCAVDGDLLCCHSYIYTDDEIWKPTITMMKSIEIKCTEYRIFFNGQFRSVWIGQCPVCRRVHYNVERMKDEWFDL